MIARLLDFKPNDAAEQLQQWLSSLGEPRFRSKQILGHLFGRRIENPERMSNVPRELRTRLAEEILRSPLRVASIRESVDGTRKYGFELVDGGLIESVWIPTPERGTLCVSSQAGCPAGCTFCATAAGGFTRNLAPSEIVMQWLYVLQDLVTSGKHQGVTQIVFMGMGEPLLNYPSLSIALELLTHADGFAFSPRRITVSTVGFVDQMSQLLQEFPQVRLALSLHSAIDETRSKIVPVNRKHGVAALQSALCGIRPEARRVTLEYVVLTGVNDSADEAEALAEFATETASHINLLPFHPFPGASYLPTDSANMTRFKREVERHRPRLDVTIRKSRGLDIQGACGQLALHAKRTTDQADAP